MKKALLSAAVFAACNTAFAAVPLTSCEASRDDNRDWTPAYGYTEASPYDAYTFPTKQRSMAVVFKFGSPDRTAWYFKQSYQNGGARVGNGGMEPAMLWENGSSQAFGQHIVGRWYTNYEAAYVVQDNMEGENFSRIGIGGSQMVDNPEGGIFGSFPQYYWRAEVSHDVEAAKWNPLTPWRTVKYSEGTFSFTRVKREVPGCFDAQCMYKCAGGGRNPHDIYKLGPKTCTLWSNGVPLEMWMSPNGIANKYIDNVADCTDPNRRVTK
jgi:hypothetical protein